MIVITGAPRCGTSAVFDTARHIIEFGQYVGEYHIPDEHGPIEFNPSGYWELPIEEILGGINDNRYFGKLIKLHGLFLEKTDARYVQKVVFCKRSPKCAIPSAERLCVAMGMKPGVARLVAKISYDAHMQAASRFLKRWSGPVLYLGFGEMDKSQGQIGVFDKLKEFLWHTQQ